MHLYAISAGGLFLKFGVTRNIGQRFEFLQKHNPLQLKLLYLSECVPGKVALSVERVVHKAAVGYHVRGEWFKSCPKTLAIIDLLKAKGVGMEISEMLNKWAREELRFSIKQHLGARKKGMYDQAALLARMD